MTRLSYSVEVDKDQIQEALSYFQFLGGNSTDAVRVAINRAGPRVRTKASQEIRTQVSLRASDVKKRLDFKRATRNTLSGRITAESRGLLLSRYSTAPGARSFVRGGTRPANPPRGIKTKVKPTGAPELVTGAPGEIRGKPFFMILPKSGALAIAGRRQVEGKRGGKIKVFYGPSVSQVFNTVRDQILPEASDLYQGELLDAMRYLLQKRYPRE